eukprot:TRINITY_DN3495_c0_g1_i2.p1 TRINITY_DN3495_c0_g1~~TRINITY_DN3495_c0_g1_i2.p1  ORF type:complete len:219 (-),score=49.07 TRINITY_DN3495_c0_g1_i2:168-764(-)
MCIRDSYSAINRDLTDDVGKLSYKEYRQKRIHHDGWYLRADNNGWRPINHKMLAKDDFVEIISANKIKYYHHKKEKRQLKDMKKKRINKLRWLQKLYKDAKTEELKKIKEEGEDDSESVPDEDNPFESEDFLEYDEDKFDDEAKKLIEWSENLDFDKYQSDWLMMSTSSRSDYFLNSLQVKDPSIDPKTVSTKNISKR